MAHEIRNPLATAGGFARRLRDSLPRHDPNQRLANIIVEEVVRMENFLRILLSSIKPFDLSFTDVNVNELLRFWVAEFDDIVQAKGITVVEEMLPGIPRIKGDEDRLNQAFENILKHAFVSMPDGGRFFLSTNREGDHLLITLRHDVSHLADDDLEHFFYPHIEDEAKWSVLDLPLSKIIIHRHGGKVDVFRGGENELVMEIEFPMGPLADPGASSR